MNTFSSMKASDVKNQNKNSILKYIYDRGITSRTDVGNELGLSKPTVSLLVDELVQDGYLQSVGIGTSTNQGGKRPQLYDFNPLRGAALAVFIGIGKLQAALVDLKLNVLQQIEIGYKKEETEQSLSHMSSAISHMVKEAQRMGIDVFGIGVSAPGIVESETGILVNAAHLEHWSGIPLGAYLKKQFRLPVWVDNATRNAALAEKWAGIGKKLSTFITIQTVGGVGTGIFLGGVIYKGIGNSGGEFGHTTIDINGALCSCGNHGCWELYASDTAFYHRIREQLEDHTSSLLARRLQEGEALDLRLISECYLQGDVFVREQVQQYAKYLAAGIVNLVNVFNPEMIILQGQLRLLGPAFLDEITVIVKERALASAAKQVQFTYSKFKEETKIIGAAALVVKEVLKGRFF